MAGTTYVMVLASFSVLAGVLAAECDPHACPQRFYMAHYTELQGCTPVYAETDACCPASFDCESRRDIRWDRCYYEGTEFNVGEELPADKTPPCLVHCRCIVEHENDTKAIVSCVNIECPEFFGFEPPGELDCVRLYEQTSCCSTAQKCGSEVTESEVKCQHENNTYIEGERFYPDEEPCMTCTCQQGFNGSLVEPYCKQAKCNLELHYTSQLRRGCVPVYYEKRCCPIDWICPKVSADCDVIPPVSESNSTTVSDRTVSPEQEPTNNTVCNFGSARLNLGEKLPVEDSCVRCECVVPPVPTCVKNYANC